MLTFFYLKISCVLTCVTRFGRTSITVHGTVSPASVNTRVMPAFRPTSPIAITASFMRGGAQVFLRTSLAATPVDLAKTVRGRRRENRRGTVVPRDCSSGLGAVRPAPTSPDVACATTLRTTPGRKGAQYRRAPDPNQRLIEQALPKAPRGDFRPIKQVN
jgi:hypothetical protein